MNKRMASKLPLAADIVGLPATQLADMLDDILTVRKGDTPGSGVPAGLLGLAETLRASLALPPHLEGVEQPPDTVTEEMLPELRIVAALLADIPRGQGPSGSPRVPSPEPSGATPRNGLAALPEAVGHRDLAEIRAALRRFAGEVLPDQIFQEVMAITASLAGESYEPVAAPAKVPARNAATKAVRSPDDGRGDRLLTDALAIQATLDHLDDCGAPQREPAPPAIEPPAPLKAKVRIARREKPAPVLRSAPVAERHPEPDRPAVGVPATEMAEARPARRGKVAPRPEPAATPVPEPVAALAPEPAARALSVKLKPSRRAKAKPPAKAPSPPAAPEVAEKSPPEPVVASSAALVVTLVPPEASPEAGAEPAAEAGAEPAAEAGAEPAAEAGAEPAAEAGVEPAAEAAASTGEVPIFVEPEEPAPAAEAPTAPPSEPPPSPLDSAPIEVAAPQHGALVALIEAIILAHSPAEAAQGARSGDMALPERTDMLEALLADPPPATDFVALDLLAACWGKGAHDVKSRALVAAAQNLSRNFGLPGKLPMAACRAWKMLDCEVFQEELAHRLAVISAFIADWSRTQRNFLILEFGEIELIEHLFEALHPADHLDLLANVMNVKALSNRRLGLLRRIPNRIRKQVQPMLPAQHKEALVVLAHTKALLEKIAAPNGFPPIIDAAGKALEEVEKLMKQAAAASAPPLPGPPGAGGGLALGRIG